jgi:hypothetical protein
VAVTSADDVLPSRSSHRHDAANQKARASGNCEYVSNV